MAKRPLTDGELAILTFIQEGYGPHNNIHTVHFSPANEAVIFCKLQNGMNAVFANLSNLAAMRAGGTIASDEELKKKWLRLNA